MSDKLRGVIATDLPATYAVPETESTLAEIDDDITMRDIWLFGPLFAAAVALPIVATLLLGASAYHLISRQAALSATPAAKVASRWPDREMPTVVR